MNNLIVVVDADAIIAQTNSKDSLHQRAEEISQKLIRQNVEIIYPVTAIAEATAHMQRVLGDTVSAFGTAQLMSSPSANVIEVNKQTLSQAMNYFSSTASKKNTLFDCIVATIAEEYKADAIFSFDKFYEKKGFKLASNLK